MVDLRVRGLDEDVVYQLRGQARRHGKTLAVEIRDVLTDAARRPRQELIDRLQALRDSIRAECGVLPDSTAMIREERERLG